MGFLFLLALATLIAHVATAIQVYRGVRSIRALRDLPPLTRPLPRVSIIIPARNEERNLEEALRSILALDYDNLEIDVVDDRSTDRTGEILDRMAAADPRPRIVHDRDLAPGWPAKNHAFGLGALRVEWYASTGELIQGLMKNAFSGVDYRVWVVVVSTVMQLITLVWPFLALFLTSGPTRWLNLASVLVLLTLCWINAPLAGVRRWHGLGFPLATLLFLYILWRA